MLISHQPIIAIWLRFYIVERVSFDMYCFESRNGP